MTHRAHNRRILFVTSPDNGFLFIWRSEKTDAAIRHGVASSRERKADMLRTTLSVTVFVTFIAVMFGLALVPDMVDHYSQLNEAEQVAVVE